MRPSPAQVEAYRRDGFVIVTDFLGADEVDRVREGFDRLFAHRWETGIAPDEVNYTPGLTPADRTRQLCNVWRADRAVAATVLAARNAEFAAGLEDSAGMRIVQDNALWKPPGGQALAAHQDCAYVDFLDPVNMTTCWMALDDTSADAGTVYYLRGSHRWPRAPRSDDFHAPEDWLAHARASMPESAGALDLVPVEVPAGGAAFHSGWVFHGSPSNQRADAERRSIVSHLTDAGTRHSPSRRHPTYSRYLRPGDDFALDEAFFPVLWRAGGSRSPFLEEYLSGA